MAQRSLQPAICECERICDWAAVSLFKRKIARPIVTIQTRGRHSALAWFSPDRWQNSDPEAIPEINICAENLAGTVYDIAGHVVHEMVHYCNWLDKIHDCSASQYHNRRFRDRCQQIGLECEKMGRYGWAHTKLSEQLRRRVDGLKIDPAALTLFRRDRERGIRGKSKLRKWSCACKNVWAAVAVDLTCNQCGKRLLKQD